MDDDYLDLETTREGECVICAHTKANSNVYFTDSQRITDDFKEANQAFAGGGWMSVDICDDCFRKLLLVDDEDTNKVIEEENDMLEILQRLFRKELIKVEVNISPEHAPQGDGKWNATNTYITIGDQTFEFQGSVEIIEGV
jgi:hypothetical protein